MILANSGNGPASTPKTAAWAMVVFMVIFVAIYVTLGGSSWLAGIAYRTDQWLLFGVSVVLLVASLAATVYISVPRWGGKLQERVIKRLYAKEGTVRLAPPPTCGLTRRKWLIGLLGATFGTCILASVVLSGLYDFPKNTCSRFRRSTASRFCWGSGCFSDRSLARSCFSGRSSTPCTRF